MVDYNRQTDKYAPRVSFDVPVIQMPQMRTVNRPDINTGEDFNFTDLVKDFKKDQAAAAQKQYDDGLNNYARKVNEIAEGQRQGQYDIAEAEMRTRSLDDEWLSMGYKPSDLYKIRDKYDGGIRHIEEERQKNMVMHEQNRINKYKDDFREQYNMPEASDQDIEEITKSVQGLMNDVKRYKQYAGNEELSKDERDRFMKSAGMSAGRLSTVETIMKFQGIVNDPMFDGKQLTPDLLATIKNQAASTLQDLGYGTRDAHIIVDKSFRDAGYDYLFSKDFKDLQASNEYIKTAIDTEMNHVKAGILSQSPNLKVMMAVGGDEAAIKLLEGSAGQGIFEAVAGEIGAAARGFSNSSMSDSGKVTSTIFNNRYQPQKLCDITHNSMCNKAVDDMIIPVTDLNKADLSTDISNINQVIKLLEDPNKMSKLSTEGQKYSKEQLDKLRYAKGVYEGVQFAKDTSNLQFTRDMTALLDSAQLDRLVIDGDGLLKLKEETKGFMQKTGNFLGYEGTRQQIERTNAALEGLTPVQRAAAIQAVSKGAINAAAPDEKYVDTSKALWTGYIKQGLEAVGERYFTSIGQDPEGMTPNVMRPDAEYNTSSGDFMRSIMLGEDVQNSASSFGSFIDNGIAYIKDQFFPEAEDMPIDSAQLKKELDAKMPKMIEEYKKSAEKGNKSIEKTSAELMDIVKNRMESLGYTPESLQLRRELSENYNKFQGAMQDFIQIEVLKAKLADTYREEKELYETGFKKIDEKYDADRLADEMNRIETPLFTGEETTQTNKVSNRSTLSNAFVEAKPAVENYESMIQQSAARYNVDPQYLDMIAAIESRRGNDKRTSTAGAKGIMQFMPKTWKEEVMPNFKGFTEADINDPQKSIEAAAWYLDKCQKFVQTVKPDADPQESAEIQAACYNWGMGKVRNALNSADGNWDKAKRTMPDETKKYVGYVKKYYKAVDEFAEGMEAEQSPESYEGPAPDMQPSNVVFEDEFTTGLSEVGEQEFMQWFQTKKNSGEIMEDDNGYDYDWKGFYNDPSTDKSASTKSHFTDKYKKPTHDTFSVESKYAKGEMKKYAGKWEGDKYIPSEAGADKLYKKLQNVREELNSMTDRRSRDYKELKAYVKELEGYLQNFFNSRGK